MHILVAGSITDEQIEHLRDLYEAERSVRLDGEVVRITYDQAERIGEFYRNSMPAFAPPHVGRRILNELLNQVTGKQLLADTLTTVCDLTAYRLLSVMVGKDRIPIMLGHRTNGENHDILINDSMAYFFDGRMSENPGGFASLGRV